MFKKLAAVASIVSSVFLFSGAALAVPPLQTSTLNTASTTRTLTLPPAADNSNVISLGTAIDSATGKKVDGLAIIHRKSPAKPGSGKPGGSTTCYTYLAKGAKWKVIEPWITDTANSRGLDSTTVFNLLDRGISKWEAAAGANILGPGTVNATTSAKLVADTASPDNQNEVYFADISDPGTIAVTIVWGIFGGPVSGRQLVEWDQVYDDTTYDWSAESAGVSGKMDFDNIATHELGHSAGMGDLYNSCIEETMYGYSATGEIKKRDLNSGDITGINSLY